jgi:hypothetical protein
LLCVDYFLDAFICFQRLLEWEKFSFPLNCSITKQREEFEDKQIKEQFGKRRTRGGGGDENNERRLSRGEGKKSFSINSRKEINWHYTSLKLFSLSAHEPAAGTSNEAVTMLID